ncbi:MAG: carbonic anhydrase [archaeon]|nr:carbonic anhydrase [archaeon]
MSQDHKPRFNAGAAFKLLTEGNARFLLGLPSNGDHSAERRRLTAEHGQYPYAIVVTCSDSRVVPEIIFSAGIGDLFVIRTAGNTIDGSSLGSIEYAIAHLGVRLVVVMGHTHCGAITAAVTSRHDGHIGYITDEIQKGIGDEKDVHEACIANIHRSLKIVEDDLPDRHDVRYVGAIYDIVDGSVEFFEDLHESE